MSRLGMTMAVMAAAALMSGSIEPPRRDHRPEPPKVKSAGNPAGSKYKNRKKRNKPLFRV